MSLHCAGVEYFRRGGNRDSASVSGRGGGKGGRYFTGKVALLLAFA